jgi:F-type H+-transporting ATPase subunit epsilon
MPKLNLEVISKTGIVYSGQCSQVVVPCIEGEIGFMVGHEIVVAILRKGTVKILGDEDKLIQEIDVESGYVEMKGENDLVVLID